MQASQDGNISTSVFELEAGMEDDGQYLGCQATNELIPDVAVEDQWRIQVHCEYSSPSTFAFHMDGHLDDFSETSQSKKWWKLLQCIPISNKGFYWLT